MPRGGMMRAMASLPCSARLISIQPRRDIASPTALLAKRRSARADFLSSAALSVLSKGAISVVSANLRSATFARLSRPRVLLSRSANGATFAAPLDIHAESASSSPADPVGHRDAGSFAHIAKCALSAGRCARRNSDRHLIHVLPGPHFTRGCESAR
jgi:hypothetical protein